MMSLNIRQRHHFSRSSGNAAMDGMRIFASRQFVDVEASPDYGSVRSGSNRQLISTPDYCIDEAVGHENQIFDYDVKSQSHRSDSNVLGLSADASSQDAESDCYDADLSIVGSLSSNDYISNIHKNDKEVALRMSEPSLAFQENEASQTLAIQSWQRTIRMLGQNRIQLYMDRSHQLDEGPAPKLWSSNDPLRDVLQSDKLSIEKRMPSRQFAHFWR